MVKVEILNNNLIRHYSDNNKKLIQNETNIEYDDAVDKVPCQYTYRESENDIERFLLGGVINEW